MLQKFREIKILLNGKCDEAAGEILSVSFPVSIENFSLFSGFMAIFSFESEDDEPFSGSNFITNRLASLRLYVAVRLMEL